LELFNNAITFGSEGKLRKNLAVTFAGGVWHLALPKNIGGGPKGRVGGTSPQVGGSCGLFGSTVG
jgi:hypothetical protein